MSDHIEVATLGLLLGRLERLNESVVAAVCAEHGVSPAEVRVLAMLRHGSAQSGVRPTEISRWVVQTTGGLTATLRRLEADGRISREDDPDDGRGRLVRLTEAGAAFYDLVFDQLSEAYGEILAAVDVETSTEAVRRLIECFEHAAGRPTTRQWDLTGQRMVEI